MRDYAIQGESELVRKKSDFKRLTMTCSIEGCPWRLHASILGDHMIFMIKSLEEEHICVRPMRNKNSNCTTK